MDIGHLYAVTHNFFCIVYLETSSFSTKTITVVGSFTSCTGASVLQLNNCEDELAEYLWLGRLCEMGGV